MFNAYVLVINVLERQKRNKVQYDDKMAVYSVCWFDVLMDLIDSDSHP